MMKISKITDYGIVLLASIARQPQRQFWTAKDLAEMTRIPQPTVGKILKILSKNEILASTRGSQGGYKLQQDPEHLSLAQVIQALEGRMALTECAQKGNHACGIQSSCVNKTNWQKINSVIFSALEGLSLADMAKPLTRPPLSFARKSHGP